MSRVVSRHNGGGTSSYTQGTSHHGGPRSHLGQRSSSKQSSQPSTGSMLSCNRCRKPVATTVFVCKCDCIFCQSCTYSHFSESSQCPACGMTLGTEDFLELCIADPSSGASNAKMPLQNLLTKSRSDSTHLSHQDMCMHVLQSVDQTRRSCKLLLKQMVIHQANHANNAGSLKRAYETLQAEHTQLQQSVNSERLETQQSIQELKNRNAALTNQMQEMEVKMKDQERQIGKFREHFRSSTPGSSHSIGSSSSANNGKGRQHYRQQQRNNENLPSPPPPPMQAFVKKGMAANRQSSTKRTVLGQTSGNYRTDPIHPFSATPIHIPDTLGRPSSGGSSLEPRVRDVRSTSSYTFGVNHQRSGAGHSPAMAFAQPHRDQSYQGFR